MEAVVLEIIKKETAVLAKNGQIIKLQRSNLWPGDIIEISEADLQKNGSNRIKHLQDITDKIVFQDDKIV